MSEVFDRYERQYCELSANLSCKCSSAALLSDPEQKQEKLTEIQEGVNEADMLIRKMDLEARSLPPNLKAMLLAKLREYKSDLNNLKRELKRISSPNYNQTARDDLLDTGMADAYEAPADQRERLAFSTERLNQSSERIRQSNSTALQTEHLAVNILEDLQQQRETLLHSHAKLHEVDNAIDKSKKILTAMSRRISKNKWIMGLVIGVLLLAVVIIVYFKFIH